MSMVASSLLRQVLLLNMAKALVLVASLLLLLLRPLLPLVLLLLLVVVVTSSPCTLAHTLVVLLRQTRMLLLKINSRAVMLLAKGLVLPRHVDVRMLSISILVHTLVVTLLIEISESKPTTITNCGGIKHHFLSLTLA
jgi:hypothetical protein